MGSHRPRMRNGEGTMRAKQAVVALALAGGLAVAGASGAGEVGTVLVEAEAFEHLGGWVVDQQFMDEMGSPYVLAHGLGEPVADANTTVTLPAAGRYRVWVRTRDWVAPWKAPGAPGRFEVRLDGKALAATFGTEGADWHWQDGGAVEIAGGKVRLALRDLTGFEGRCDAICFTPKGGAAPPDDVKALTALRRKLGVLAEKPGEAGRFDLVVVGGGIAGTAASLSAARLGLKVALVQDRPVLGGNNSSEVRVWLQGETNFPPYPRIGDLTREMEPRRRAHGPTGNAAELYEDDRRIALVKAEKSISLFLGWRGNAVEMKGGRIAAVVAQHIRTADRLRFEARLVADCTGHGVIGALAGADYEMTAKGHMGRSNLWNIVDTGRPQTFPRCAWALDLSDKPFPQRLGVWFWESGFDHDPLAKGEYIRDANLRAMYGAWDALKNVRRKYPNHKLAWAAYVAGTRESRRLLGDVVLTKKDLLTGRALPDACVPATWSIDLHLPDKRYDKGFEGDAFISKALFTHFKKPAWVPYRCLYSRNVPNLFMAGRDISVTHEALGSVRVMRTTGMMGEVVGMAASICKAYDTTPRGVYRDYLAQLQALMAKGVGKEPWTRLRGGRGGGAPVKITPPDWLAGAGANLARRAKVTVSSNYDEKKYPPRCINDGQPGVDGDRRWVSARTVPNWAELSWAEPVTLNAVRFLSGYKQGGRLVWPIHDFVFQVPDGAAWRDLPETKTTGNTKLHWHARLAPVTTKRLRLYVTAANQDTTRLFELELYHVPGAAEGGPKP